MDPLTIGLVGFAVYLLWKAQSGTIDPATGLPADQGSDLSFGVNVVMNTTPEAPRPGRLSPIAIAQLAANAGFTGQDLVTAVAIALAESSGNPGAVGDLNITPGGSVGLWQINLRWHPEFTAAMLVDPQTNANAAFKVYRAAGNSFQPWSTFKTGAYTAHLEDAQSGVDVVA